MLEVDDRVNVLDPYVCGDGQCDGGIAENAVQPCLDELRGDAAVAAWAGTAITGDLRS